MSGGNGNGVVWAIPQDRELPPPAESIVLKDRFLSPPKPLFALDDFMKEIDGDHMPMSYLQAAIAFHELHEFGAVWHGVSWGRDTVLPAEGGEETTFPAGEWAMIEEEPEILEPHFFYIQ
ncbi:hypothetical protein BTO30_11730 [Domibacillus antri]|uniref:Uncharacterized protein n=1 Tax=Domibacillus antri TaxID=1714264 RepID=A0A1Q8Q3R0_9BACI|nr:hypothetical protein [Domibacillus antri]OLN21996.1 hypothetical protein BTO30_11730 [Domibacillus antri]